MRFKKKKKRKNKRLQAHNNEVQSRNGPPDAVQGKSKRTLCHAEASGSRRARPGWQTVGLKITTGGKSHQTPRALCGFFLVPLGIPANLHLCQLDIADGIGVWRAKIAKG